MGGGRCDCIEQTGGVAWAEQKGIAYFDTVDQLAAHVDAFAILAPSTPETHVKLCEQALPYGKPTFVDKTFAPDAATAELIYALADRFGTPIQSTSALRSTNIQQVVAQLDEPPISLAQWAGGASFEEYGVHPVELAVSCLGHEAERLTIGGRDPHTTLMIEFSGGRVATIDFNAAEYVPFYVVLTTARESRPLAVADATLFIDAAAAILDFFEAGDALVPKEQTMAIMRILDAAQDPAARAGWVPI